MTVVGIHQPNYCPWVGYFHKIASVDKFIFLDDVQYSRGSYTNRVQYLFGGGARWLTVPCKPKFGTRINDVRIDGNLWQENHLNKIKGAYKKCPLFDAVWPSVENWLRPGEYKKLSELNIHIIKEICSYLDIGTEFYRSSEILIGQELSANDRLVKLTKFVGGNEYFSGLGARKYQDERDFFEHDLSITYSKFIENPRRQDSSVFQRGLSVLDLILNIDPIQARSVVLAKG